MNQNNRWTAVCNCKLQSPPVWQVEQIRLTVSAETNVKILVLLRVKRFVFILSLCVWQYFTWNPEAFPEAQCVYCLLTACHRQDKLFMALANNFSSTDWHLVGCHLALGTCLCVYVFNTLWMLESDMNTVGLRGQMWGHLPSMKSCSFYQKE